MRTTMRTINAGILRNLNNLTTSMQGLTNRISSGKELSKLSDNPVGLFGALSLRTSLAEIKQYQKNLLYGNNFITAAESTLMGIKDLALRAKTLALQTVNAPLTMANRASAAEDVKHLFEQAVTLANTQVSDKYIFGGYRTTGYNTVEPTPFIMGLADGYRINAEPVAAMPGMLTGKVGNTDLTDGDLLINNVSLGDVLLSTMLPENGLYMQGAAALKGAINAKAEETGVTASLTSLYAGGAAPGNDLGPDLTISFRLNNVAISVDIPANTAAPAVVNLVAEEINRHQALTGVEAEPGNGIDNGGIIDGLVLKNLQPGDESDIVIADLSLDDALLTGLSIGSHTVADGNTGQISLSGASTFTLASSSDNDDILALFGWEGGDKGFADEADDGVLVYGPQLAEGALKVNGIAVPAAVADPYSDVYADASAMAKATAIDKISGQTGVTAMVTPAQRQASGAAEAGMLDEGDLVINGIDIFNAATQITTQDSDNVLMDAINAQAGKTGVVATRDHDGRLLLAAIDGRNLHIQTSARGEAVSHLNIDSSSTDRDRVYFGSVQLRSSQKFMLETTPADTEPGLAALGLDGGAVYSGQATDIAGDGKIWVTSIDAQEGSVRYAGDRENDLEIKVGQRSTLEISKNGQDALMTTGVFSILKDFENYLRGEKFTEMVGSHKATNTVATLDSGLTGLASEEQITPGKFAITIIDHAHSPPRDFTMEIKVDPEVDTLQSIARKLNGVPGLTASWNKDGYLEMKTGDQDRYTFSLHDDSSNFLNAVGVSPEDFQVFSIQKSISALDRLMEELTNQISDFGARSNRIDAQNQILFNLELATTENLSETEDTDLVKAIMDLKGKELAYQAALSAAAKTMQLSLVNYL